MLQGKTEREARSEIVDLAREYYRTFRENSEEPFKPGDRISYASRVYDEREIANLVDASLEFWLTSGRYTEKFEKDLSIQALRQISLLSWLSLSLNLENAASIEATRS